MRRRKDGHLLRFFVYVSDAKLAGLLDQIDDRTRRNILDKLRPSLGVSLAPVNLSLQPQPADRSVRNRSRAVQVAVVEEHIRQQFPVGDLAVGEHWITGRVDMEWAPLQDGRTVLFCGYAGPLLVALGGSVDHLIGQASSGNRTGSHSYAIRTAVLKGNAPETLGNDLAAAARTICCNPQPVRFLAQVIMRGTLAGDGAQREFVLATPLYVEDDHRADESANALIQGTVRWFNADRGWGLIVPEGDEDAVVVNASAVPADGGPVLAPGQRVEFRVAHGTVGIQAMSVRRLQVTEGAVPLDLAPVMRGQPLNPSDPCRIDRYEILRRLGEGSMGTVYLARADDGSLVAVKVIRPEYARDPIFLRRFQAEADNASRVQAPGVARVIAAVTGTENPYLVTEFVNGPTLEEQVERHGPLAAPSAIDLARRIATALAAIHQVGIVHRDLVPSNVILSASGPKIIDFGIAQALSTDTRHTQLGRPVGTPAFMSPEQINQGELTPASDIFAWAGLTVFAVTGHQPFANPDSPLTAVWRAISDGEPNLCGVPRPLQGVLRAALNKEPRRRPTAQELLDGQGAVSLRSPPSLRERCFFKLKKFRIGRNIQIAASAATFLGIGALVWILVPGEPGTVHSTINYSGGKYNFHGPDAIAVDSTHVWVTNDDSNSVTELNASNGAWVRTITGRKYMFSRPEAITDDGTNVWVTNYQSHSVIELNASNGTWIRILAQPKYHIAGRAIAEDDAHIWIPNGDSNSVTELNATSGAWIRTVKGRNYGFNYPWGIAADGAHVWVCNGDGGSVTEFDASNGAWVRTIQGQNHGLSHPKAIAADGTHVWVANYLGNSVTELNARSGAWIRTIKGQDYGLNGIYAIADDGAHVWVTNSEGDSVTELNASTGTWVRTIKGRNYGFNEPWGIAAVGNHVWVTNRLGNSVTELNSG